MQSRIWLASRGVISNMLSNASLNSTTRCDRWHITDHLIAMTSWMNAKKARSWTFLRNTYTLDREVEQSRNHFDASWCRLCIPIQAQKQLPGRISLSQFYHQWTSDHFPIIESIVAKMVHHTNLCYLRDCKRVLFPSELLNRHINSIGNKIKTKWPMAYMYP
jgi:hypothetical protein